MTFRASAAAAAFLLLAACSQQEERRSADDLKTYDVEETAPPSVSPSAAPGVAWRYDYSFQLPDKAIAPVQEAHAAQCEALGITKCRITGLNYELLENDYVSATLEVKLAPEVARSYGKGATETVVKAAGRLKRTHFEGTDTAADRDNAARALSDSSQRIADLERQLANTALKSPERAQIQSELAQLRSSAAGARQAQSDIAQRLANTPMRFNYVGKGGVAGFEGREPVADAFRSFVASLVTMVTFVLQTLAVVLPWAVLLLLLFLAWRSRAGQAVRRFFRPKEAEE